MRKRLTDLTQGEKATIEELGDTELSIKLMEMGCIPGENVTIEKIAPLGDPISIFVSGYHLSLRLDEAEHIFVVTH